MGIRKRRKRLTTTLSSYDQRIRSVELRPISLLTTAQINAAVELGIATADENFYIASSAPNTYTRVEDAYYYPKKLTGKDADYVEIYTQPVLRSLSTDGRIEVSGIHGTTSEIVDVTSNNFTVTDTDTSPWSGRESYEHDPTQDQDAGVVIGYSYSFTPESLGPSTWTTRKRLATKFQINSFSITGTTVTVTTSVDHKFEVNDVIFTSINDDAANNQESATASGVDGLFVVTATTNNTLEYELSAGVDSPTGSITPTADVYIYPTARNWSAVGDTWIDTSTNPDTTYYWTGLRWAEFTSTTQAVGGDSVAPNVVSNVAVVSAESGGYTDGSGAHRAKITLEWDAPTDDANGDALNDLAGYEVWASYVSGSEWTKSGLLSTETTFTIADLDPAVTVYFNIFAVDTSLNRSTAVAFSTTSGTFAGTLNPPSAPDLSSDLGVVTAKWDGLDNTGVNMHPSVRYIETHVSDTSPFTTSSSTRVASMAAGTDNYSSIYQFRETSTGNLVDMAYGQDYYFKFVAVDSAGNSTAGSSQSVARISQVDGASIEAGAISTYILNGESITATSNTSNYEIQLNANFLRAVHKTSGVETFRMNSSDGSVQIGSGITNTTLDGNGITVSNLSANAITTGTLDANNITVTNLSASSITSGVLNANNITVTGTISGNVISGGTITGSQVSGGSLTTQQASSRSVEIIGSDISFKYSGTETANIYADAGTSTYLPKLRLNPQGTQNNGWSMFIGDVDATIVNGNATTVGVAGSIGTYLPGGPVGASSRVGFYTDGWALFNEGIVIGSSAASDYDTYRLSIQNSRLESRNDFRANANLNVGGDFYYSPTTSSSSGQPLHRNTGTNLIYGYTSAARFKQNIQEIQITDEMVEAFLNVQVKQFNPIENPNDLVYGFIAEDLEAAGLTDLVVYGKDSDEQETPVGDDVLLTLDFYSINALGQHIIRQQQTRISELENTVTNLVSRIEALEGN